MMFSGAKYRDEIFEKDLEGKKFHRRITSCSLFLGLMMLSNTGLIGVKLKPKKRLCEK